MSKAAELAALIGSQSALSNRNLIINGAMQVWQRGTGSTAVGSTNTYHADRWLAREDSDGSLTTEQSTDAPANFKYSNKVTVTSADTSIGAAQKCYFSQRVEGTVFDSLGFGTSAAKTTTLSFYVKSSLTGTFSGSLTNDNNNRSYPYEYTISSANTWERKSVTFPGDTTGTWDTGSTDWLELYWDLGIGSNFEGSVGDWVAAQDFGTSGSTKLIGTNGATWLISGVQWEQGEVATPFEHRSFGEELQLCKRYFQVHDDMQLRGNPDAGFERIEIYCPLGVSMRANPSRGVITEGNSTNIRSSTTTYSGFILANRTDGCTLSLESNSAGLASFDDRTESLDAEL